jgi:molybdopterin converting factor small subunit
MVKVVLWGSLKPLAGGEAALEVEASNIGEMLRRLVEEHPGLKPHIERGVSVSIDGQIYRDAWFQRIPEGSEVFLLPRLAGG